MQCSQPASCDQRPCSPSPHVPAPAPPHLQSPHVDLPVPPHAGQGRLGMMGWNSGRPRCVCTRHCPSAACRSASGNSGCWMEGCCCWSRCTGPAPLLACPPGSSSARAGCGDRRATLRAAGNAACGVSAAFIATRMPCNSADAAKEAAGERRRPCLLAPHQPKLRPIRAAGGAIARSKRLLRSIHVAASRLCLVGRPPCAARGPSRLGGGSSRQAVPATCRR